MRKALLILRIPLEVMFGLLYMSGLLLLPSLFTSPASLFPVGYLGMPRRVDGAPVTQTDIHQLNHWAMLGGLLFVSFLVANGLLWFKDVYNIIQKLRQRNGVTFGQFRPAK